VRLYCNLTNVSVFCKCVIREFAMKFPKTSVKCKHSKWKQNPKVTIQFVLLETFSTKMYGSEALYTRLNIYILHLELCLLCLTVNAVFSNISVISWRPVLVVEETGVPGKNHRPWASKQFFFPSAPASRVHPFLEFTKPGTNPRRIVEVVR
jgi:hypothetical protein